MQRIVSEPVKRFHDRARAGKLSSERSNQKQVNLAFGEVSSQKRCAMQRIVHQKSRSTELNLALVAD
jgi:hypothetical protein